ncbi:hypothetical protein D3C79_928370 [compost metagenome]
MTQRCRIRLLRTGVHVTFIIVLDDNHFVTAQRSADGRSHPDIHPAVTGNHNKGKVFFKVQSFQLTAAFAFPEHFNHTGQRSCTVLEQIVDKGLFMR